MSIINNEHFLTEIAHFEIKMLKFFRDYFSHSHQGLSYTKNAPCLGINNFHIWYVIDMGISQFESLFLFKQKNHSLESNKRIEEIISVKLITL